jgi:ribonuclease P protein component
MRVGVVVPKYGHTAVARNQLKRRLRELVRLHLLSLLHGVDVAIWAQRAAYDLSYDELHAAFERAIQRVARLTTG